MSKDSPYSDWRVYVLWPLISFLDRFRPFGAVFSAFFLTISPTVPVDLRKGIGGGATLRLFLFVFAAAFFFCFLVTGFICYLDGTLIGPDVHDRIANPGGRRYFLRDGWNLSLYALVCPVYVALSVCLIGLTIREWAVLAEYANSKGERSFKKYDGFRFFIVLALAILLCVLFITNYFHDILNPDTATAQRIGVYWFMAGIENGAGILNRAGYYYVVLNFFLLFITLIGAACFLSLASEVVRAGSASSLTQIDTFEVLHEKLKGFTAGYLLMKSMVAAYTVNFIIWNLSPLGITDNMVYAKLSLVVVGIFFCAVPRQYVELKWFRLWRGSGKEFEYVESRSTKDKAIASALDAIFISTILSIWSIDLQAALKRLVSWISSF